MNPKSKRIECIKYTQGIWRGKDSYETHLQIAQNLRWIWREKVKEKNSL